MALVDEFHLMNLDQRIIKGITSLGWERPTDVQQAVIPLIFESKSIVVQAKTGSGKTAAFAIPLLHELLQTKQIRREQFTTVLVLAPTKELCNQSSRTFKQLCKFAAKNISLVDVSQYNDAEVLRPLLSENPDVIIGTPARILSHLRSGNFSLNHLKHLVVDEADLIFTFGYQTEIQDLKSFFPTYPLQVILLSATLDDTTKLLRRCLVKGGEWVRVELPEDAFLPSEAQLTQYTICAEEDDKFTILIALIKLKLIRGKTLIFTNSVDRCFKLRLFLEEFGIRAALLNSELPVMSRCHAIDQFNRGLYDFLLATDEDQIQQQVKATSGSKNFKSKHQRDTEYGVSRGIDFHLVSNVINFDFPVTPALYVHRVGRTARADQMGTAVSFVSKVEEKFLAAVEKLLNPVGDAACASKGDSSQTTAPSVFKPYQFRLSEVDGFRYRAKDILRNITRKVIREARLKEIKLELLNSERLKGYFEDHVPDLEALRHDKPLSRTPQPHLRNIPEYMIPEPLRALMPNYSTGGGRKARNLWRRDHLELGSEVKANPSGKPSGEQKSSAREGQEKRLLAKKRKAKNPLFSFDKKKRKT